VDLTPEQAAAAVERHPCPKCAAAAGSPCRTGGGSEKISTRVRVRPELEQALTLCRDIKGVAPGQVVILAVHEMKRLARNAAELMTLAGALQAGVPLTVLSPDPNGDGWDR